MTRGIALQAHRDRPNPAERVAVFLATGFGVGRIPYAPGTFGTLVAIPVYLALATAGLESYLLAVALLFGAAVGICAIAERRLPHDDGSIVIDEVVGYLVTMLAAPRGWSWLLAGFVLFRLFDIWKPFPVRGVDRRVPGGLGTVLDDALAGVYAWAALQGLAFLMDASTLVS